jgi:choline-sulfatase
MLVAHPGHVPQATVNASLLSHYDIFPTLLDYLGFANPDAGQLPGQSFAPLLSGESTPERDHVVVFDEYGPVRMIRTRAWKYVHRYPYGPHELYDLVNDPDETCNLIDDPAQQARRVEMEAQLETWFAHYVNPHLDGTKEPVTGKGQIDLPGLAGQGRRAFEDDWWYIDEDSCRRDDQQSWLGKVFRQK